jgi:hypothetical protein
MERIWEGSLVAVHCLEARVTSCNGWERVLVEVHALMTCAANERGWEVVRLAVNCLAACRMIPSDCWADLRKVAEDWAKAFNDSV